MLASKTRDFGSRDGPGGCGRAQLQGPNTRQFQQGNCLVCAHPVDLTAAPRVIVGELAQR
jgi:hypothetical protein